MLVEGVGVDPDYQKAVQWMEKSKRQDVQTATKLVYDMLKTLAVEKEDKRSCYQLGLLYIDGAPGLFEAFIQERFDVATKSCKFLFLYINK